MGAADATLKQRDGATPYEYIIMSHIPRPMEASDVGSHVKPTPEASVQILPLITESIKSRKIEIKKGNN